MILDLFFPNRCIHCDRIIDADALICELCFDQINFTHWSFEEDNLLKMRCKLLFPTENAFALMLFEEESLSREIVHELKYRNREKVGKILAEWTCERLNFEKQKPDILVSVPLHPKKQKERGYNQLHFFTENLSQNLEIPYNHNLLKRNYYKKAQALRDKVHRNETENLFSLTDRIENQHVLIIDDVFTTGNTMASIAWEILKKGNNKVSVLVMAMD